MTSQVQNKLVVFDVEGIVIPKARFTLVEVMGKMGAWPFIKAAFLGLLYEIGLVSLRRALRSIYMFFKGMTLDRFISLFEGVPLMPGVENVFGELKKDGFKIVLISSGIPRVALERLGEKLGVDHVSGLEIGLSDGFLTGEVWGDVIEPEGKGIALRRIINDEGLAPCYCIGVADDRNNLSMLQLCDLKIAHNPDFVLSYRSDYAIKGELSKIVPIVKGESAEPTSSRLSRSNVIREVIHLSGFIVALACRHMISRYYAALLVLSVTLLYTSSEIKRMFGTSLPLVGRITSWATEKSEFQGFVASPMFYGLGIALSLTLFPEPVGYVSITVLTLGDGFAAIFGEEYGRTPFPLNKTKKLEGTLIGLLFAFLGSLLFVDLIGALIASLVGMVAEVLPLPVNDNLTIPLASGLALIASLRGFL